MRQLGSGWLMMGWVTVSIVVPMTAPARAAQPASSAESLPLQTLPAVDAASIPDRLRLEGTQPIPITLVELIQVTLQGNRELRDQQLQRIVQRQELQAAEQAFDPRITPNLSVGLTQDGATPTLGDNPVVDERAELNVEMDTPLGTSFTAGIDPLSEQLLNIQVTQPLLRGFGRQVNEAPVAQARLSESINQLTLKQQVIDTVTRAVTQYTALIQAQASVKIQAQALERRQQELRRQRALVQAGRAAGVSLLDNERLVADAQRQLILAQNELARANTDLLNLVGTDQPVQFVALLDTVERLFAKAVQRTNALDLDTLLEQAYQGNPELQQVQLGQQQRQLDLVVAEDNLRWQLNLQGTGEVGELSRSRIGLVATRQLNDPALETQRVSSEVALRQETNRWAQQRERLHNDVTNQLLEVRANLAQVEAATRAQDSAEARLAVTRARFRQGEATSFEVSTQEENLVAAQNAQLQARIRFLDSLARLEQTVGITLDSWRDQVDFQRVLGEGVPVEDGSTLERGR